MDKFYLVLNALLDEIDFLDTQLQEALAEGDYEQAHWLQEGLALKYTWLQELESIFIPVQKRKFQTMGVFVVNKAPASSIFADHLKAFLQKDTDITIEFQKRRW